MTQQLIKQIELKITDTQQLITNYKQEITQHENTLLALIKELTQIKQQIKENMNNKKITKISPKGLNKTK